MALGAVALGYGHPAVNQAAEQAIADGVVGPLPPVAEEELAAALAARIPWLERVRFLKTGAEAVAAAVRIARVVTGREHVLGCGYHGWLDWCQGGAEGGGIPAGVRALFAEVPFNDVAATRDMIRDRGRQLAAVVVEPVVVAEPTREWLDALRAETQKVGAVLIFDEIKTAFRLAIGGAGERYGVRPDLAVLGKALANGFLDLFDVGDGGGRPRGGAGDARDVRARGRLRSLASRRDAAAPRLASSATQTPGRGRGRRRYGRDVLPALHDRGPLPRSRGGLC